MVRTVPTGRGAQTVEVPPEACPNGHPFGPRWVQVGSLPCSCVGERLHRTYRCRVCDVVMYVPPHDPGKVTEQGRWA